MKKTNNKDKSKLILTKETLGVTLMLFSALVFIMLLTHKAVFLSVGGAICTFMYGTFGYASFIVVALLAYLGECLTFEKKIHVNFRIALCVVAVAVCLFMLFHAVTTRSGDEYSMSSYGSYLSDCFNKASEGFSGYTFGGVLCGLIVYPVAKVLTYIGAYVVFSILTVLFCVLTFLVVRNIKAVSVEQVKEKPAEKQEEPVAYDGKNDETVSDKLYSVNNEHEIVTNVHAAQEAYSANEEQVKTEDDDDKLSRKNLGRQILFQNGEFAAESYRRNMIFNDSSYFNHPVHNDDDYISNFRDNNNKSVRSEGEEPTYTESYSNEVQSSNPGASTPSYVYGDTPVSDLGSISNSVGEDNNFGYSSYTVEQKAVSEPLEKGDSFANDTVEEESYFKSDDLVAPQSGRHEDVQNDIPTAETFRSEFGAAAREDNSLGFVRDGRDNNETAQPVEDGRDERTRNFFNLFTSSESGSRGTDLGQPHEDEPAVNSSRSRLDDSLSATPKDDKDESLPDRGRDMRSRETLFDDDGDDGGNLFGDEKPLTQIDNDEKSDYSDSVSGGREVFRQTSDIEEPKASGTAANSFVQEPERVTVSRIESKPAEKQPEPEKPAEPPKPKHVWKKYVRPTLDLLDDYPENNNVNTGEIEDNKRVICETLANFRIDSHVSNVVVGPAITRYDVIIEDRTNIKNAMKYRDAIAMALMKENVNAYLNYAKGAISIEVPNSKRTTVGLKGILASSQFINAKPNSLTFAFGKNVDGQVVCPDITKMPHLLVAGTTGSGKSICLSALIVSLLYKYGPEELRFILVDPKQVEFISYDKLPHLMINEIIYDVDKALKALNWAIKEMERRYSLFKEMTENGVATKNLTEYNAHLPEGEEKLPKIVIILDEFGDLMLQAKKEIESRIIRLVQKARACGIHLILATQRPSVDCITGLIKSNLPTRIGFKVNSFDDSRCIFDIGGAEKLLGKGDSYFRSAENPDLQRIQGCFIDTPEVQKVTDFVKANNETYFDESVSDFINTVEEDEEASSQDSDSSADSVKVDDTFIKALWFCVTSNQASVSMIQRRFPIGYMKACKIIDWMENMNYITASEGSKPRKVILSRDEFIQKYGTIDD